MVQHVFHESWLTCAVLNKQVSSVSPQLGVRTKRIKTACEIIFTLNVPQTFDPKQLGSVLPMLNENELETCHSTEQNLHFCSRNIKMIPKPMGHRKGPSFYIPWSFSRCSFLSNPNVQPPLRKELQGPVGIFS